MMARDIEFLTTLERDLNAISDDIGNEHVCGVLAASRLDEIVRSVAVEIERLKATSRRHVHLRSILDALP